MLSTFLQLAPKFVVANSLLVDGHSAAELVLRRYDDQLDGRVQQGLGRLSGRLLEKNVTGTVKTAAEKFSPLTRLRNAWAGARKLLVKSARCVRAMRARLERPVMRLVAER